MNDDLISRRAVTDLIMETDPWWCEGMTRTIFDGINRLPSVDAVPVIRCKDCKHRPQKDAGGYTMPPRVQVGVYAWGEPEYDDDESCPYVCEDRWYSDIPNDEQYCDRAERKEHETD